MSLNDIRLNPQLLSDLYASLLVETNASDVPTIEIPAEISAPEKTPTAKEVHYLGKNEKGILILVSNEDAVCLPDVELAFLTTILAACQLSLADVAILNWKTPHNLDEVQQHLGIRHVLLFDVSPLDAGLPINFPHFQIQQFNHRSYLSSPSLSDVEKEVAIKRQLWPSLKKMFSI
jgi:DNA polymerase III psi subunit